MWLFGQYWVTLPTGVFCRDDLEGSFPIVGGDVW